MKKILSTRVLVKICVLTTILLVLIIYTIWGNSALMVSMVNISSDRIASAFSNFRIGKSFPLPDVFLPCRYTYEPSETQCNLLPRY